MILRRTKGAINIMKQKRTFIFLLLLLLTIYVCTSILMVLSVTDIWEIPTVLITVLYITAAILTVVSIGWVEKKTSIHELLKTSVMIRVLYIFLIIVTVTLVILTLVL